MSGFMGNGHKNTDSFGVATGHRLFSLAFAFQACAASLSLLLRSNFCFRKPGISVKQA